MVNDESKDDVFLEELSVCQLAVNATLAERVPRAAVVVRAVPFSAQEAHELSAAFIDLDLER